MAEQLANFDFPKKKYPWEEWLDGNIWRIKKGEDYDIDTENMRIMICNKGRGVGKKIESTIEDDSIVFQAKDNEYD
jgi:hypothetical protein